MSRPIHSDGYFAGICEPCVGGFCAFGALIRKDGVITWAASEGVGQGARCNVNIARFTGAVTLLRKLRALHQQWPANTMRVVTDSQIAIQELRGEWRASPRDYSALLDQAADLRQGLNGVLTLRWIPRCENLVALELAKQCIRRYGVEFDERHVRGVGQSVR